MSRGPDGGEYVDDQYRCMRCGNRRRAINTLGHRPDRRHLTCANCQSRGPINSTEHILITPITQETTTMTTTIDPRHDDNLQDLDKITLARHIEKLIEDARLITRNANRIATEESVCSAYDVATREMNERMHYKWFAPRNPPRRFEVRGVLEVTNPSFDPEQYARNLVRGTGLAAPPDTTVTELPIDPHVEGLLGDWRDRGRPTRDDMAQRITEDLRYLAKEMRAQAHRGGVSDHFTRLVNEIAPSLHWAWFDEQRKRRITMTVTIDAETNDVASAEGFRQSAERALRERMPQATVSVANAIEVSADGRRWRDLSREEKLARVQTRRRPPAGFLWHTSNDDAWSGGDEPMPCSNSTVHGSHHYHPASGVDYWCPGLVTVP